MPEETINIDLPLSEQESKALKDAAASLKQDPNDIVVDAVKKLLKDPKPRKYLGITKQVPKQHYIKIKVSEKRLRKLAAWIQRGDIIDVNIHASKRDVYLENMTVHNKWARKMIREGHVVEIEEKRS